MKKRSINTSIRLVLYVVSTVGMSELRLIYGLSSIGIISFSSAILS